MFPYDKDRLWLNVQGLWLWFPIYSWLLLSRVGPPPCLLSPALQSPAPTLAPTLVCVWTPWWADAGKMNKENKNPFLFIFSRLMMWSKVKGKEIHAGKQAVFICLSCKMCCALAICPPHPAGDMGKVSRSHSSQFTQGKRPERGRPEDLFLSAFVFMMLYFPSQTGWETNTTKILRERLFLKCL